MGAKPERATYQAYGARESDYRPTRFGEFREDYGFTGKEEDVEVGLTYFGKRFYAAALQRWVSADPLEVHGRGSTEANVYAYVSGLPIRAVDPNGLEGPSWWESAIETGRQVVGGVSSGVVTSLTPGGGFVEAATGKEVAELATGSEKEKTGAYHLSKALTEGAIGLVEGGVGIVMTVGGSGVTVASGGVASPVTVPVPAGGVAVLGQSSATLTAALGDLMKANEYFSKKRDGAQVGQNYQDGKRREDQVQSELETEHPDASVQREQFLRDENGKIVKDPVTGEGRRVDHAVIEGDKAKLVETTGPDVDKTSQMNKEARIRESGGEYVRDRNTGQPVKVEGQTELRRRE